jgi:predicted DNA binding protein
MWVIKFQVKHKGCWISTKTAGCNVVATGIPLNFYEENGKHYNTSMVFLSGDMKEQKRLISEVKKEKQVKKISIKGNQITALIEEKDMIAINLDKTFFFIKPVIMKGGLEYWEIGCWERKKLMDFYDKIEKFSEIKLLKLKKEFPSFFLQQAVPRLTEKQRQAFDFAKEQGYYEYPKRISIQDLAKLKKIPRTTFQSHLKKAENKILTVVLE